MFDLFLVASIAFGSESINTIGLRHKSGCHEGSCSVAVAVDAKKAVVATTKEKSRVKRVLRGKKCR